MGSDKSPQAIPAAGPIPAAAPRRVVVVAGMHRGGTSVVARGLLALGIDLGDRLMAADQCANARGFFEDNDIVKLDDALLDAFGADWKNLALLDDVDWHGPASSAARIEARQLLEARLARTGQFGFKDPRVPRLLPFWQGVFAEIGLTDAYVIAVRHPLSVIDSLTVRDALDVHRSGWLWLTHLVCALRYTAGRPRVVVDYDRLLAAPERELSRMAQGLRLSAPAGEAMKSYTDQFLSKTLRHAEHASEDLLAAPIPPLLQDAYALVQRLAKDESDAGSAATNAEADVLFGRLAALSPLLAYAGIAERAADQVPHLRGELDWARTSLAEASAYSESLRAALQQRELVLLEAQRYAESLEAALHRRDEALVIAKAYNEDLSATIRRKDEALAIAQAYNDDLSATIRRKDEELIAAYATLDRIRQRILGRMLLRRIERLRDSG